jgi:hypothetical protein
MPPHVVIVYPPPFGRLQRRLEGLSKTDWGSKQAVVIEPEPRRQSHRRSCLSQIKFATDSPLEGDGFEPSVPRERDYAFQDRPVRSLRQFRSRDGDNFRQAGGGTDLGRPASRQINRRRCVKWLTHVPGLASIAISGSAPGCAWGPACYGGRHAEDQSMEPQHAEGRARPALARGAPSA